MDLQIGVVEGRFAEGPQWLGASDGRGEFAPEQFVDDEAGIVAFDVEIAQMAVIAATLTARSPSAKTTATSSRYCSVVT